LFVVLLQDSEQDDLEYQAEKQDLLLYCTAQKHLIDLYVAVTNLHESQQESDSDIDITMEIDTGREQSIAELLHVTVTEASDFLNLVDRFRTTCLDSPHKLSKCTGAGVGVVALPTSINVSKFLTCFVVSSLQQQKRHSNEARAGSSSSPNFKIELQDVGMTREITLGLGWLSLFYRYIL